MNIKIGSIIRELRRKQGITQEKLAGKLGTTPQAVSRWENEVGYPDIESLNHIADIFGVSMDVLFERNKHENEIKIQHYLKEYKKLNSEGELKKKYDLMSEAYELFPLDFRIMLKYCWAKMVLPYDEYGDMAVSRDEFDAINQNIIDICKNVLDDCTDDDLRYDAMSVLSIMYRTMGKTEDAIAIAKRFPNMWQNRELELLCAYDSNSVEFTLQLQEMTEHYANQLSNICIRWSAGNCDDRQKILFLQKAIAVYDLIYDDGNLGFYHNYAALQYKEMGDCHLRLKESDNAIDCYEKFFSHAKAYDNLSDEHPYSAKLVNRLIFKKSEITSGTSKPFLEYHLPSFEHESYDAIRTNERFLKLLKK